MNIFQKLKNELNELKANNNYRKFQEFSGNYINLSSNDYIGIAKDKILLEDFYNKYKNIELSSSSSRLMTGSYPLIMELEKELKNIYKREGLVFNSGFEANQCIIETIFQKDTLILTDRYNHASIYSGILSSGSKFIRYNHFDYVSLEKLILKYKDKYSTILVISETIYSMDGDCADLKILVDLKRKYGFLLMIDEAHSYGVLGYGISYKLDLVREIDYLVIPLGKGGGSMGAYLLTDEISKDYLINKGKKIIYTTALPPITVAWNLYILKNIPKFSKKINILEKLSKFMHKLLKENNIDTVSTTHIISIVIGENKKTNDLCLNLREKGFLVFAIKEPTVPKGTSRLRLSLNVNITEKEIENFVMEIKNEISNIF